MEKLRSLKATLKGWNKEVFSNLDNQIESLRDIIENLDLLVDHNVLSVEDVNIRSKAIADLWAFVR